MTKQQHHLPEDVVPLVKPKDVDPADAATLRPSGSPLRHDPTSLLRLQRAVGNTAIVEMLAHHDDEVTAPSERPSPILDVIGHGSGEATGLVVQRDDGGGGGGGGGTDPGAAGRQASGADGGGQEQMVSIDTDQGKQDMPKPQALAFLQDKIEWSSNKIDLMAGENAQLQKQRDEDILNSVIGSVADVMGGFFSMPDPSIWDNPKNSISAAKAAVASGDPVAAGRSLQQANDEYQKCREQYLTYKEGNFSGADNTITALKGVIMIDAVVAAVATGGATLGAAGAVVGGEATATVGASGIITQAAVAGAVGAETTAIGDVGDQAATGKPFNWAELAEQTAGGFAGGFLGACISGPLKEMLTESASGYVTEELMSEGDLAELAKSLGVEKVERDFLQSELKKFLIDKLSEQAGKWLAEKPIDVVVDKMKEQSEAGEKPPSAQEAVDTVAQTAAPTIAADFKESLKASGGGKGSGGAGGGGAPGNAQPAE